MVAAATARTRPHRTSADSVPIELLLHVPDDAQGAGCAGAEFEADVEGPYGARSTLESARMDRVAPSEFHARIDAPRGAVLRVRVRLGADRAPSLERVLRADCGSLLFLTLDTAPVSAR